MTADDRPGFGEPLIFVVWCIAAGAVVGLPGAALWVWLADPPAVEVTTSGAFFGEAELNSQVEVTLWFFAVGAVLGLVCGLVAGALGNRHGVVTVLAVLTLSAVASGVSAYVGVAHWGSAGSLESEPPALGATLESGVEITSKVAYLGWPIGGLIGAATAISRWPRTEHSSGSASSDIVFSN
ncbi:MAG: hypothetical protein H0T14_00170 [Nocardioidaceae bacterium]|nr:hypothetical protein [Nocardioidaceae bacterium]